MDLDFSFALISTLTPRCKSKTALAESNSKGSTKSLKLSRNRGLTQNRKDENQKTEKENHTPPKRNGQSTSSSVLDRVCDLTADEGNVSSRKSRLEFPVNMANVVVRRPNKTKSKPEPVLISSEDDLVVSPDLAEQNSSGRKKRESSTRSRGKQGSLGMSDHKDSSDTRTCERASPAKRGVKRKSPQTCEAVSVGEKCRVSADEFETLKNKYLTRGSNRSSELESPLSPAEGKCKASELDLKGKYLTRSSLRSTEFESSLSPAYDSDPVPAVKKAAKAIPETPESDESFATGGNKSEQLTKTKAADEASDAKSESDFKGFTMTIDFNGFDTFKGFNTFQGFCDTDGGSSRASGKPRKKLRSSGGKSNDCNLNNRRDLQLAPAAKSVPPPSEKMVLADRFKIQSAIQPVKSTKRYQTEAKSGKADVTKVHTSAPTEKESTDSTVRIETKYEEPNVKTKAKKNSKPVLNRDSSDIVVSDSGDDGAKISKERDRLKKNSPKLVPPTETIPKLEHISNWLKNSQDKAGVPSGGDVFAPSVGLQMIPNLKNVKVSLSPRIKKKKKVAQSSLEDEQKLFKELYGEELAKRLSDEVDNEKDEMLSIASSRDSMQSEKMLEELYGDMVQKNTVLPKSEPKKGRKKVLSKKSPRTEKKKQRTSIYEVFSSSSSEDRFEEFLESVKRGKLKSRRSRGDRPATPDFIRDSDSESEPSPCFYQNILSSAVKDDLDKISNPDRKVNGRRLSFGSSQDAQSEGGRSDSTRGKKTRKPKKTDKTKDGKKRRARTDPKRNDEPAFKNQEIFTLMTPIKIKDKKAGLDERVRAAVDNEVPKSVGKSKPPKTKDLASVEDRLRAKYLDGDFKVPAHSLKTPSKPLQRDDLSSSPCLSFLSSLSGVTGGLPCHPDAIVYKKNYKAKREELSKKLFCLYNKEIFENQLPAEMLIQWNTRMTSTSGFCYNKRSYVRDQILRTARIVLSTKILDRPARLRDTLIHELCHAATWIINGISDGHGPQWRRWAGKANQRFPELPVIKRCHDYEIKTKYTYKCVTCGYCIGRHSKSLDVERKRCGYCFGVFQLFVTSKMAADGSAASGSGSARSLPAATRAPTGFALFVKDNYAQVKRENNASHAQVMKLLSQKFADVKIGKNSAPT